MAPRWTASPPQSIRFHPRSPRPRLAASMGCRRRVSRRDLGAHLKRPCSALEGAPLPTTDPSDCPDEDVHDSTEAWFGPHHYHYRSGELLVGEEDLDRVRAGLRDCDVGVEVADSLEGLGVHL